MLVLVLVLVLVLGMVDVSVDLASWQRNDYLDGCRSSTAIEAIWHLHVPVPFLIESSGREARLATG